jgi:hypothetical protein
MSNCHNFGRSLYSAVNITGVQEDGIHKPYLKTFIDDFTPEKSGVWQLAKMTKGSSRTFYGSLLGNPQNIDDTKTPPCSCSTDGNKVKRNVSFAYNDMSDEAENGPYCEYCQDLNEGNPMECQAVVEYRPPAGSKKSKTTFIWPLSDPITDPPTGEGEVYSKDCCEGGCDTRAKTDDLAPKIPYLYNNYLYKFFDFKYLKQFPAIENTPLGMEKFITLPIGGLNGISITGAEICIDWTMKARIGEIPLEDGKTYHANEYSHNKAYARYLLANKTAGNFILQKVNTSTEIAQWQKDNMELLSTPLTDDQLEENKIPANFPITGVKNIIPEVKEFTAPYGITDDTHYNIFLKSHGQKDGGYWKWNYTSGVFFWYRYYDIHRKDDDRFFPGVDIYISDGDVLFATNDGPEPLPLRNADLACVPKACPSGLKMTNYQTTNSTASITVVPSGSEFIYISSNIYDKVYGITERLFDFYSKVAPGEKTYKEVFNRAAVLATSPQYDGITVDLYKKPLEYNDLEKAEFIKLIKELNPFDDITRVTGVDIFEEWLAKSNEEIEQKNADILNEQTRLDMTNKKMVSYNKINMVQTTGDLINTLVHKYGCYGWIPPKSSGAITINKKIYPHATLDIDFEPVVKLTDTKTAGPKRNSKPSCDILKRGNTKLFSYDQSFSIGEETLLYTKFLDEGLVYNASCSGDPPSSIITDVGNTISIYFREHQIFSKGFNNFQTVIQDRYSRFPSVSSTLDTTFSDLDLETDAEGNEDVFFLKPDRLLRLERVYNAIGYNQSVDLVAFHKDGGCYYDSTLLTKYPGTGTVAFIKDWKPKQTKHTPTIGFKTYDMGIKFYSIGSELLRSSDNLSCKTLPLDQACNCWGLNKVENFDYRCNTREDGKVVYETPKLFTPYLSTRNIPLQAYGGYSENKLTSLVGGFRIPEHPNPGAVLPTINKDIDTLAVNGCRQTYTFTLPNYVATKWGVKLPEVDVEGADIWVSFSDSYGFAGTTRTQNKLVVNGQEIFPNEQAFLKSPSQILEIKIYNQLLNSMFDSNGDGEDPDSGKYLYVPEMFSCSNEQTASQYGSNTGPSSVTITITRIPKVNSLNFALSGVTSAGKLKKTFFHPNIGILADDDPNNPKKGSELSLNRYNGLFNFNYDKELYDDESSVSSPNDITFAGSISLEAVSKLSNYVNMTDVNKKIRLYFKLNNQWYEYEDDRAFGYFNDQENNQYHSWPTVFTESHLPREPHVGPFIPAIPKEPLPFLYAHNIQHWANIAKESGRHTYPYMDHSFVRDPDDPYKIHVYGSRMYFMIPNLKTDLDYADPMFVEQEGKLIPSIMNEDNVMYEAMQYSGGVPSGISGTLLKVDDSVRAYYMSLSDIDSETLAKKFIYESEDSLNGVAKPIGISSKEIVVNKNKYSYPKNSPLVRNYINIYTELKLSSPMPIKKGFIQIFDLKSKSYNFTVIPTVKSFNQNYQDLIKFNGSTFSNKWSDLIYTNNTADALNNQPYYLAMNQAYGPFLHENLFNYVIANNHSYSYQDPITNEENKYDGRTTNVFDYKLYLKNAKNKKGSVISFQNPMISYYIHRDFSADNNPGNLLSRYNLFKNSNPILDINIYNSGQQGDGHIFKNQSQVLNSGEALNGLTGVMCIKGINKPRYEAEKPASSRFDFFVNLNKNFKLKPLPIKPDAQFYSKSFVLTDPYSALAGLKLTTKYKDGVNTNDCTNLVLPGISMPPTTMEETPFNWNYYAKIYDTTNIYNTYPIYCDIDKEKKCGETPVRNQCTMNQIGSIDVQSIFATYLYKYKTIDSIPDEVEFAFSVDAGLYCPLFPVSGSTPTIVRSEFAGYSALSPTNTLNGTSNCIDGASYPPLARGLSVWDDIYQYETKDNIIPNRPIDSWANEMMFRAIHGSKQKVNLRDISKHTNDTNRSYASILSELLNESKNNISSVYNYIPYDYDKIAALQKIKVDGAFRIIGPARVGDKIKIVFNNNVFNIEIKDDGDAIIAECKELEVKGLLHEKYFESTSIYIREQETDASSVVGDNVSERVVDTCRTPMSFSVVNRCAAEVAINENDPNSGCSTTEIEQYDPVIVVTDAYTSDSSLCSSAGLFSTPIILETSLISIPNSFSNNVPCSAFSVDSAKPDAQGDLDAGFNKYAGFSAIGSAGGGGQVLECGMYQVYPCSVESNCCGEQSLDGSGSDYKTVVTKRLSYRIKNCHYDLTMKGLISNSLFNAASYTVDNSLVESYVCQPRGGGSSRDDSQMAIYEACCGATSPPTGEDGQPIPTPCSQAGGQPIDSSNPCCGAVGSETCISPSTRVSHFECQESYWMTSCVSDTTVYEIVETTTKTESPTDYLANCNRTLATFTYDNNQVKLTLGVRKLKTISNSAIGGQGDEEIVKYNGYNCKKVKTKGCPYIKVELPNNLYGIDEFQSTQCQNCHTSEAEAEIVSNPNWQFQIDTHICVLGAILTGGGMTSDLTYEMICDPVRLLTNRFGAVLPEGIYNPIISGPRSCGSYWKNIGDGHAETEWFVAISNPLLGSEAKPGLLCEDRLVAGPGYTIGFPAWTSNATSKQKYIDLWKATIEQRYAAKYYCTNSYGYKEEDLIEGVIPGSCSLNFGGGSWPGKAFRIIADLTEDRCGYEYESETTDASVSVMIAYMTYQYKRPVTVNDKIIDELGSDKVSSSYCRTHYTAGLPKGNCKTGMFNGHFTNVVEKIESRINADTACPAQPTCYDKVRNCAPTEYCCKVDTDGDSLYPG